MKAIGRVEGFRIPVEIYADGRAKAVRGSVVGHATGTKSAPSTRRYPDKPNGEAGLTVAGVGSNPAPSLTHAFDSKLEAKRDRHFSMLVLTGDVKRYRYHPFTIQIGPGKRYTPDFLIEYADSRIVIEEVKGSLKMKNARDSVTRLHVAAGLLPMFAWRLVIGDAMEERIIAA